ncbi:unnamed protein product [Discosporangium mesarthrocarpum]
MIEGNGERGARGRARCDGRTRMMMPAAMAVAAVGILGRCSVVKANLNEPLSVPSRRVEMFIPFCRKDASVGTIWMPLWDEENAMIEEEERVVVFGGRGLDYVKERKPSTDNPTDLDDLWVLHIRNNDFVWKQVTEDGRHPSARWLSSMVMFNESRSMGIYGGEGETTMAPPDDLWIYTPQIGDVAADEGTEEVEGRVRHNWVLIEPEGAAPGPRRGAVAASTINNTIVLQGGVTVILSMLSHLSV